MEQRYQNQQPKTPKVKITSDMIKGFKTVTCPCGGMLFENALLLKKIPALISPSGQEEMYPMEILICKLCGKVPEELNAGSMLPDEILAKNNITP